MCGFCGGDDSDQRRVVAGPGTNICEHCVHACAVELLKLGPRPTDWRGMSPQAGPALCCSFCGKARGEVWQLIAGSTAYICDECVGLSASIVPSEQPVLPKT